jgi:hypothetical protein
VVYPLWRAREGVELDATKALGIVASATMKITKRGTTLAERAREA